MDMDQIMRSGIQKIRQSIVYCRLYLWKNTFRLPGGNFMGALHPHRTSKAHLNGRFASYRDDELLDHRLDAGFKGFWFEYDATFVHAHWYAMDGYDVWDIRCKLLIPHGAFYLFDVYTVPGYRGHRFFQEALACSTSDIAQTESSTVYALTQARNAPANAAFLRAGFQVDALITFLQFPPLRYQSLQRDDMRQQRLRVMRLRNAPLSLDLGQGRFVE